MTKEEYINIRRKEINKSLTGEDIAKVFHAKCVDGGATSSSFDLIKQCIIILLQNGMWEKYWKVAKKYFDCKFSVVELYGLEYEKHTPLGTVKTRDLLSVY